MPDIFGNTHSSTGLNMITAQDMILTVSNTNGSTAGALTQNIVIQFAQPVQTVREIGSRDFRYFSQPPAGTISLGRIVGEDKKIIEMFPVGSNGVGVFSSPRNTDNQPFPTIIVSPLPNEDGSPRDGFVCTMSDCIAESFGATTDSNGAFVQEQVSIRFGSLSFSRSV